MPYAGMGKVFDFLHATNDVLTERGVDLPLADITQLLPFIGYPRTLNALRALDEITL